MLVSQARHLFRDIASCGAHVQVFHGLKLDSTVVLLLREKLLCDLLSRGSESFRYVVIRVDHREFGLFLFWLLLGLVRNNATSKNCVGVLLRYSRLVSSLC